MTLAFDGRTAVGTPSVSSAAEEVESVTLESDVDELACEVLVDVRAEFGADVTGDVTVDACDRCDRALEGAREDRGAEGEGLLFDIANIAPVLGLDGPVSSAQRLYLYDLSGQSSVLRGTSLALTKLIRAAEDIQ